MKHKFAAIIVVIIMLVVAFVYINNGILSWE